MTDNAFCSTGPGGGVDPSCGRESRADREEGTQAEADREVKKAEARVAKIKEKLGASERGETYKGKLVKAIQKQLRERQKGKQPDDLDRIKARHEKRKAAIDARFAKRKQKLRDRYKEVTGKDL